MQSLRYKFSSDSCKLSGGTLFTIILFAVQVLWDFHMQLQTFFSENWNFVRLLPIYPRISCIYKQRARISKIPSRAWFKIRLKT